MIIRFLPFLCVNGPSVGIHYWIVVKEGLMTSLHLNLPYRRCKPFHAIEMDDIANRHVIGELSEVWVSVPHTLGDETVEPVQPTLDVLSRLVHFRLYPVVHTILSVYKLVQVIHYRIAVKGGRELFILQALYVSPHLLHPTVDELQAAGCVSVIATAEGNVDERRRLVGGKRVVAGIGVVICVGVGVGIVVGKRVIVIRDIVCMERDFVDRG
ncbi:hypothetical protein HK097_002213 [Rhizophlyctis rosea]|uniref:Uncharacterized protein n=1 Tax=Rhizophlyctis rosea TaxID=64517 RepID=A0AAD5X6L7_9FUNG|nr:hypothetical protein HK097_002213 [Rhizophlyctis rosea]